jgi:hypothetical protein
VSLSLVVMNRRYLASSLICAKLACSSALSFGPTERTDSLDPLRSLTAELFGAGSVIIIGVGLGRRCLLFSN